MNKFAHLFIIPLTHCAKINQNHHINMNVTSMELWSAFPTTNVCVAPTVSPFLINASFCNNLLFCDRYKFFIDEKTCTLVYHVLLSPKPYSISNYLYFYFVFTVLHDNNDNLSGNNPLHIQPRPMYNEYQQPHLARQLNTTRRTSAIAQVFRSYKFRRTSSILIYMLPVLRALPVFILFSWTRTVAKNIMNWI